MFSDTLGGYYGREDLYTEFKAVCIKGYLDLDLSMQEAEELLDNEQWNNKLTPPIINTLKIYFNNILPKYISSFCNSKLHGSFIMGIEDCGEITGIPIYGEIDREYIVNKVELAIRDNIVIRDNDDPEEELEKLIKNIDIEIIKLNIDPKLIDDEHTELYETYKNNFVKRNNLINEYNIKRYNWLAELETYSTKLVIIVNTTKNRLEMIEYIKKCTDNILTNEQKDIIELLKTETYISIPKFPELDKNKKDPNSVIYWLVKYKDYMTEVTNKKRPRKPCFIKSYSPIQIVSKLSVLRSIFIKNSKINYYIIKININHKHFNGTVMYTYNNQLKQKKRMIDEDGPYSE